MSGWTIGIIAVVFGVSVLALLWFIVAKAASRAEREWKEMNPGEVAVMSANGVSCAAFPGEKITLRGNGLLVLTSRDLHFHMWAPKKILKVAINQIELVNTVKSFAGRWGRLPMLHIVFRMPDGGALETAFSMAGARNWVDTIGELRKKTGFSIGGSYMDTDKSAERS